MMEERLELLRRYGAYLEGHFKLSSGLHSGAYIQCAQILQYPKVAAEIGEYLASEFKQMQVDLVISPAIGGIIIGHEVARALDCRCVFGEREDDVMKLRRGFEVKEGEKCIIIEDVITTGKATKEIWNLVENGGGIVKGVGCIVNRSQGLNLALPIIHYVKLEIANYKPEDCPMCKRGDPIVSPGSRWIKK
jgi:orotate phosphoribosyltransferase